MSEAMDRFTFIDLFAGLGGFHIALSGLGGRAVFAAEWDPTLSELYEHNFNLKPWRDINDVLDVSTQIPNHDVLAAGFPCQPFSKAGDQLGFEDTVQGRLFFKVLEILREKRPKAFILENVPNILRHRGGLTLREIEAELRGLDYFVEVRRLSPHQFGIPQVRDRAYFVGSRLPLNEYQWPTPTNRPTDIRSILDGPTELARPIPEQTLSAIDMWDDFLKASPNSVKLPSFPIWSMEFGATYPYESTTPSEALSKVGSRGLDSFRGEFGKPLEGLSVHEQLSAIPSHGRRSQVEFPSWKKQFIRQNRRFFDENAQWIKPWLEEWRPWRFPSSFQKFEWNAQGEERSIANFVLQVRASGLRAKRTNTAPSLVAMTHTQVPILGWERRYMTPRECARLQSLGAIQLPSHDLQAYKALGNAVNADVVKEIARPLVQVFL